MAFIRILVVAIVAITFVLNLSLRQRLVIIAAAFLVGIIATVAVVGIGSRAPQEPSSRTVPTVRPAPTRPPPKPSFETACRTFQLIVQDVEQGELDDYTTRSLRVTKLRSDAQFQGVPESFQQLIENYVDAVDQRLGTDTQPGPITSPGIDVAELDRNIRRARNELLSECRARQN